MSNAVAARCELTTEVLKTTNQELQSTNEELQILIEDSRNGGSHDYCAGCIGSALNFSHDHRAARDSRPATP